MLFRDLILPDGKTMLYPSGIIVERDPRPSDITWAELAGDGNKPPGCPTAQPYWHCNTKGDIIMNQHLENLTKP